MRSTKTTVFSLAYLVGSLLILITVQRPCTLSASQILPGTTALKGNQDLSSAMVEGIHSWLDNATEAAAERREEFWNRSFSSREAYEASIEPNRRRFRRMIGLPDIPESKPRTEKTELEFVSSTTSPAKVFENPTFTIYAVRWPVREGVFAEGLWLKPSRAPVARLVAVPDADHTPEMIAGLARDLPEEHQFARRLAENGCEILIPVLIDRRDTWSGNPLIGRFTNQPHREWIYRQAFELGRHIIGYEVEKVLAGLDWFEANAVPTDARRAPGIGVAGYGEGGLIAFYAAAIDTRIQAALVSGYFGPREHLHTEPIYRNVFGLLREYGDAEIATLITPRALLIEYSPAPIVTGPPESRQGRSGAAPGRIETPDYQAVENEFFRARALLKQGKTQNLDHLTFICGTEGMPTGPASERALTAFLRELGVPIERLARGSSTAPEDRRPAFDAMDRQRRQVLELVTHTERVFRQSELHRGKSFWEKVEGKPMSNIQEACGPFRKLLAEEIIGRLPSASEVPLHPRSRMLSQGTKWTDYEVVLDVYTNVFAWGRLLLPNDIKPGEKRPVVVCQHGLEGVPEDTITTDPEAPGFRYYKGFASKLAERGYIVFSPHNPYRGGDRFRQIQRKANPLKLTLFSFIVAQHSRILEWLSTLPKVDANRIGFYGLSYGGKTAMRVPTLLTSYNLSICSGDFNEWVRKNVSVDYPGSYMFTGEYEMPEWDLGHTLNYGEMAALMVPRPFMVERGHRDGVGLDEWVAYEYARVRRLYDELGIGERTAIDFFNGPHTIHGEEAFKFLDRFLKEKHE